MKKDYCFHTHTYRCNHAVGTDEDYVREAIKNGFLDLGFSDHIFLEGVIQKRCRGDISSMADYLSSLEYLKNKYKNEINIYKGFEAEYSHKYLCYLKHLINEHVIDYLILGQHFDFDSDNVKYISAFKNNHEITEIYSDQVCEAIQSGLFLYVAHPDLYVTQYYEFDDFCAEITHKICKCAEKYHVPLEINAHAFLHWEKEGEGLCYPENKFWEIASHYNIEVVIGLDAHDPSEFSEDTSFIDEIICKYGLKVCDIRKRLSEYLNK